VEPRRIHASSLSGPGHPHRAAGFGMQYGLKGGGADPAAQGSHHAAKQAAALP